MLSHVREHAFHIWERLSSKEGLEDSEEEEEPNGSEIKLIQRILQKLSRLASLADVSLKAVTHQELERLGDTSPREPALVFVDGVQWFLAYFYEGSRSIYGPFMLLLCLFLPFSWCLPVCYRRSAQPTAGT